MSSETTYSDARARLGELCDEVTSTREAELPMARFQAELGNEWRMRRGQAPIFRATSLGACSSDTSDVEDSGGVRILMSR